jgi:hypothetical protein
MMVAIAAMVLTLGGTMLMAQQDQGGQQGGRRGFRNFDPAQMQEMMLERTKERLGASDEEWNVIKPLLSDVMKLQFQGGRRGGMMFAGRRGGDQGGDRGGDRGPSRMEQQMPEATALQTAVENQGTPAADLKAKLEAYRAAQAKHEADLKAAREKLRKVLTLRQEAMLVLSGMLD